MHVVVIGAGIAGAASAMELVADGHRVTILDPGPPGGEQAASYGNGCWLSPSSVIPPSAPGLWRKVPGWLADPLGPLALRWRYLPKALPWLVKFLAAGATPARVRRIAAALRPLVQDCPARHQALAERAGVGHLIRRIGLLYVFPERADFEREALSWQIRRETGVEWIELDADQLRQQEPALDRRYRFGLMVGAGGHCTDPGAYVAALVAHAQAGGARLERARATGFDIVGGRLRAVRTDLGAVECDRAVIAAGAHSNDLARAAGDRVALESERGYHIVISGPEAGPRTPIMPSDGKMANTMTDAGLRIAGQVEIAGLDAAPDWRRAEILRAYALRTYPDLPRDLGPERVRMWMGHRPSTPDGLPCLGLATGCADIVHCFGHGHVGLAAGAISGRVVADLVAGRVPEIGLTPYAPNRFG